MITKNKRILIADDSEIDRTILRNMLDREFDIIEADSGRAAFNIINSERESLDAILLDVLMPTVDGFGVLQLMSENNIGNIPVFMITSEATKENVEKGAQFSISEFIRKPFEKEDIINRMRLKLGIVSSNDLTEVDFAETNKYISKLEALYKRYLINFGEDVGHYTRIADVMRIFLDRYSLTSRDSGLDREHIELISKAAFLCDLGQMVVPNKIWKALKRTELEQNTYQSHTTMGADIIRLNSSHHCRYFVDICADICVHHHERYDGKGFPHKIIGDNNVVYTQMCRLADRFDSLFFKYQEHNGMQYDFVTNEIGKDTGFVSQYVFSLLNNCRAELLRYYSAIN